MDKPPINEIPSVSKKAVKKTKKSKPKFFNTPGRLAALIIVGAFLAAFGGGMLANQIGGSGNISQIITGGHDGNQIASQEERDVAAAAEAVSASVVSITTETASRSYYGILREGAGTGVIVSSNGYIMTNKHVVEGASSLSVTLEDGRSYDRVRVVGTDPLNDIAFLKIRGAEDLPVATLGNSSTVKIGQEVVAIGNSLGQYQNTVTSGIISGTNRPIAARAGASVETLTDLIQTDAAINPGNSGGPLVNMSGQVIGINTAIAQNAEGIGFAIPINSTKGMLKNLLSDGTAKRSYMGVSYLPVNVEVAAEYELTVDSGAYVYAERGRAVARGGPADKAGIKEGDIITKVGDTEVGTGGGVATLIGAYAPGDTVELTVMRGDSERKLKVTLEAYPD